jgi:hypothetical protein
MAIQALTGSVINITGLGDVSAYCKSWTLSIDVAELDTTDFASSGWTEVIGGLKSFTLAVELMDDFAVGTIDDDIFAALGTVCAFQAKVNAGAISTSNPEYQGSVLITQDVVGGAVGDLAAKSLTFAGSGAIVRDVTP